MKPCKETKANSIVGPPRHKSEIQHLKEAIAMYNEEHDDTLVLLREVQPIGPRLPLPAPRFNPMPQPTCDNFSMEVTQTLN